MDAQFRRRRFQLDKQLAAEAGQLYLHDLAGEAVQGGAPDIPVEIKPKPEAAMTHLLCPPKAITPRKQSTGALSS